jgi:hypothetical protein
MNVGDIVLYTMHFDADASVVPNIGPGIITKIVGLDANGNQILNLRVFFSEGDVIKMDCSQGAPGVRGTWHLKT